MIGLESYDRDLRYRPSWTSQYDNIVAQNWRNDIVAPRYRDFKLHTSSCRSSSQLRYEIRQPKPCPVTSTVALPVKSICSSRSRIQGGAGQGRGMCRAGVSTVPCPPHFASCHCHCGSGMVSEYPRWTEDGSYADDCIKAVQARLQAYLSTPVLEKSTLSCPTAEVA